MQLLCNSMYCLLISWKAAGTVSHGPWCVYLYTFTVFDIIMCRPGTYVNPI